MADPIKKEDIIEKDPKDPNEKPPTSGGEDGNGGESDPNLDEQDPLKKELKKVQGKGEGRTRKEKLLFSKKKIEDQLRELEEDDGEDDDDEEDDDAPVTVGMMKKMRQKETVKTALQLADDIEDDVERELVKHHVANTIRSTGNPTEDLALARAIVNSKKNVQIIEEVQRKPGAKTHSSAGGAPARSAPQQELTAEEAQFMRPPFNMTKEQILAARPKA